MLLTAPAAPQDAAAAAGDGEAAARLLAQVTGEVLALLQERKDRRKAELDAHRRDVRFAVGDEGLIDTEHTLCRRDRCSRRAGSVDPFKVTARVPGAAAAGSLRCRVPGGCCCPQLPQRACRAAPGPPSPMTLGLAACANVRAAGLSCHCDSFKFKASCRGRTGRFDPS